MQFVNNDMDDVLRKAAEQYPLDTSGADWNKVAALLNDGEQEEKVVVKKNKNGRMLWLLLLLPLGLVCNYYYQNSSNNLAEQHVKTEQTSKSSRNPADKFSAEPVHEIPASPAESDIVQEEQPSNISSRDQASVRRAGGEGLPGERIVDNKTVYHTPQATGRPKPNHSPADIKGSDPVSTAGALSNKDVQGNDITSFKGKNDIAVNSMIDHDKQMALNFRKENLQPLPFADPEKELHNSLLGQFASKKKDEDKNDHKLYAGVIGGVDATTVRFQKIEDVGFDYGLLLGYRFNNEWSVEAGVFMDNKNYYTDGRYYNTSGIYLPPNTKITEVSGICRMLELPLSVKYNFSSSHKRSWFATAGVSSYIMKEEDYEYVYYYGNSGTSSTHYKSYKNSSKNFFSVLQVTGGYTHRIGKIGDLRIEPYLKVPVAQMGYGKLHLLSTGLHIGITRKLF